jgi:hypothetical protein
LHRIDDFCLTPACPKNGDWFLEVGAVLKERLLDFSDD